PTTGVWSLWTATPGLITARCYHTATLLPDGKVLFGGGYGLMNTPLADVELCKLEKNGSYTWTSSAPLKTARGFHSATLLPSGKVLVIAGYGSSGCLSGAEIFDPQYPKWYVTTSMSVSRYLHGATLLPTGNILVTGGYN